MRIGRRISIAALNNNIDDDLLFTDTFSNIGKAANTGYMGMHGGDPTLPADGAHMRCYGRNGPYPDTWNVFVPAVGHGVQLEVMRVAGNVAAPTLDLRNNRVELIADPTTAQDALTFKAWATWTPTLVWATADPGAITTVARWVQIGKTVLWHLYITSADSNATSGLTATLPVMPANIASYSMPRCVVLNNVTRVDPFGYITHNGAEQRLQFAAFPTCTDGATVTVYASGEYPVA